MSLNEKLGDTATHFLKSGSCFRSKRNDGLLDLAAIIPDKSPGKGLNVEYDITYEFPKVVHGYKYTDLLTKCVYLAPCSMGIAVEIIANAASTPITVEGAEIFERLRVSVGDKYDQCDDNAGPVHDLVLLPGTNLLTIDDYVDFDKIDMILKSNPNSRVKLHPITSKVWRTMLTMRWGRQVIAARASAYSALRAATGKIYFTMSSETGIACVLIGKNVGLIHKGRTAKHSTFEAIYRGIDKAGASGRSLANRLTSILSSPSSGIITVYHSDKSSAIDSFFNHVETTYALKP